MQYKKIIFRAISPLAAVLFFCPAMSWSAPAAPAAETETKESAQYSSQIQQAAREFNALVEAAKAGSPAAMLEIGNLFEQGIGTRRNFSRALEWYQRAADAGLAQGWYNVGICYETGMGATSDMTKAAQAFEKAAGMNFSMAQYKLSFFYEAGEGVAEDKAKAYDQLLKSARADYPPAIHRMALIHLYGDLNKEANPEEGLKWLLRGADMGDLNAVKDLGHYYKSGLGGKSDLGLALMWFTVAVNAGHPAPDGQELLDSLKAQLPAEKIAQAEEQAQNWLLNFQSRRTAPEK